ncbi:MAG TPA: hypothetical protein DCQ06_03360 [Myxococcales bacterium]|nr:hypothetical protein [Myxococcales bacterium]HAN30614.1 hypothetical protein [Myxococcales bacterium]
MTDDFPLRDLLVAPTESPERASNDVRSLLDARFDIDDIAVLNHAQAGLPWFSLLRELTRLGEADFVVRMAVLTALASSDRASWSQDALRRQFAWLAEGVLGYLLRSLRKSGWLELIGRQHRITESGEALYPIVSRVLQIQPEQGDLALGVLNVQLSRELGSEQAPALRHLHHNLCRIVQESEAALDSHSEVRLMEARDRLDRNLAWARRARTCIEHVDLSDHTAYRVAQDVGQVLSELHQWHAVLYRAVGDLASKRMQLGDSGLSVLDITQFLMRCDLPTLADFGAPLISQPVAPSFIILDNLLAEAEYELVHADPRGSQAYDHGWVQGPPQQATQGELEAPTFSPLDRFSADLQALEDSDGQARLADFVPSVDWAESAWRLSMLALAESDEIPGDASVEADDPTLARIIERVSFAVDVVGQGQLADPVDEPLGGEISRGVVRLL